MDLFIDPLDNQPRCGWCAQAPEFYKTYHDTEWGYPVDDDRRLFEKICLEGFQSGLSWRTILAKRENFRAAFANFDVDVMARFDATDVERLVQDAGIIRHRGKIEAVINNAARAIELRAEFGSLAAYFWQYEPIPVDQWAPVAMTQESQAISKDLKKRGWKFVGPTTVYAFMQAMGLVNDHMPGCCCHSAAQAARAQFTRPAPQT
ncbi:3-methyladenine DNA glycosylase [Thioclava sp. SK-1]|uniref:DNA-3-methyladenine glycosylase I n=1 Tax=Thioclava sp. SK-1 TaxID=1889770 RepID=UPI000826232F|nr:DNA-3-methyladenine glycosylase I [Thioclava sp. SK-1]OCX67069.1 3-methyladenine DNA glycosylase [Thioclava sp. SK-1]